MMLPDVEDQIIRILEDMIQDWGLEEAVSGKSWLVADLEFESIDVIQMVVSIEQHFGNRNLRFDELLMQDGRYVSDLSVQDIAEFVSDKL